jgi:hypothetical protein
VNEIISASRAPRYRETGLRRNGVCDAPRNRKEPAMLDPLGSGLTWQQFLALGLVAAFVGAVRVLDLLYQSAAGRPEGYDPAAYSSADYRSNRDA